MGFCDFAFYHEDGVPFVETEKPQEEGREGGMDGEQEGKKDT